MEASKKIIIANWKMNPKTLAEAKDILEATSEFMALGWVDNATLVFCPPFVFVEEVSKVFGMSSLGDISFLGAQDIFWEDAGSDTGEISGPMLQKLGVTYVIAGHSERRWKLGEADDIVNKKIKAILRNEMIPVVCLGEKARDENFKTFLEEQARASLSGLSAQEAERCIIAYEPVWAISSNPGAKPDSPESAGESIKIIRNILIEIFNLKIENLPKILYGGSVNSSNIESFLIKEEIDGVLIGSASVNKPEFINILSMAKNCLKK